VSVRSPLTPPPPRIARNTRVARPSVPPASGAASVAPPQATPRTTDEPRDSKRSAALFRVLRGAFGFALVVGIGVTVAWAARTYVKTSPRFAVSEIVTTGSKRRGPDELASIAGITTGQNVFMTDLEAARARLLADPWISEATLARQLPGTIYVRVAERDAAGVLGTGDGTYLVTREGTIIKRVESGDPTDLPVVTGVSLEQLTTDREGATRTVRRALDLAFDVERSPLAQRAPLEEIHVEPNGEMSLVMGKSGVRVQMGAPPYRRKIEQAVRVLAELDRRGAKPESIMLDNEGRPDRVVVRMR
jgi:cell division protein FtsQ